MAERGEVWAHSVHILTAVTVPPLKIHLLFQSFVCARSSVATLSHCVVLPCFVFCTFKVTETFLHSTVPPLLALHLLCHAHAKFAGRAFDCIFAVCPTPSPPNLRAQPLFVRPFAHNTRFDCQLHEGRVRWEGVASCPCATLLACRLWQLQLPLPLARLARCNIRFRFRCAACPPPSTHSLSLPLAIVRSLWCVCVCVCLISIWIVACQ